MDVQTLPSDERAVYNRLKEKFSLHFESITVGEHKIRVLKPSDLEELLEGRDPFADVAAFPFWARVWEAANALAQVLVNLPVPKGGRVLELGAGLGLPGLAAAMTGFEVVLSDYEEQILDFQRVSVAANGLKQVKSLHFDWLNPPDLEPFDIIVGAEILFREEFVDPLIDICKKFLKPNGVIFLGHDVRRSCLPVFLERAEKSFVIGTRKQTFRNDGNFVDILLNRMQKRD